MSMTPNPISSLFGGTPVGPQPAPPAPPTLAEQFQANYFPQDGSKPKKQAFLVDANGVCLILVNNKNAVLFLGQAPPSAPENPTDCVSDECAADFLAMLGSIAGQTAELEHDYISLGEGGGYYWTGGPNDGKVAWAKFAGFQPAGAWSYFNIGAYVAFFMHGAPPDQVLANVRANILIGFLSAPQPQ